MNTSRLLSLEMFNFMGYTYGRIDFDESNIISLKGYNSAGKTTVIRALGVINSHLWIMKQSKFIKHGANKFEIRENFSDGVTIVYEKYLVGKSSYTMYKDGEVVFSTIQDGVYTPVKAVPDYIRRYLNLIDDTKLNLHLRRGRDDLLLVDTTGRDNYEFLSSALKAEEISNASGMLRTDRLQVKSDVSSIEYEIEGYSNLVSKEKVVTTPLVSYLESVDKELDKNESKKAKLEGIVNLIKEYREIKPSISLKEIGVSKVVRLRTILSLMEDYNKIRVSVPLEKINVSKVIKLMSIFKGIEEFNSYQSYPTLDNVDLTKVNRIISLLNEINKLVQIERQIDTNNKKIEQYKSSVDQIEAYLKQQGIKVFRCKNCGELQATGTGHSH